jgi:hypothetical protein
MFKCMASKKRLMSITVIYIPLALPLERSLCLRIFNHLPGLHLLRFLPPEGEGEQLLGKTLRRPSTTSVRIVI